MIDQRLQLISIRNPPVRITKAGIAIGRIKGGIPGKGDVYRTGAGIINRIIVAAQGALLPHQGPLIIGERCHHYYRYRQHRAFL